MKIKVTSVYVDDQDKALRFYTEVLGFAKKTDFSQGPYRWLTVASPEEPDGTELQLALNNNPAAKAYQQAMFQQGQPAAMFFTDDVKADYERIKARGAEFTMPPTDVTGSTIAMLNDTCGNLIQLTQLIALVGRTFSRRRKSRYYAERKPAKRTGKAPCLPRSPRCRRRIAPWASGSMRSSKPARQPSRRRPGTGCPRMPTRTARLSASSKAGRSSRQDTRRSASATRRSSTKATCGQPHSH